MVSNDSRTYNDPLDPRDPRYREYEEARKRQAARAQQRARQEARLQAERKKQEWREEAERAQRLRRQRAQQQLQDKPYRSKFADLPQSHDEIKERHQAYEQTQRFHQQRAREQRAAHQREVLERQREYERRTGSREHVSDEYIRGRFAETPQARAEDRNRRISQQRQVAQEEQRQVARQQEAARQQEEAQRLAEEQRRDAALYTDRQLTVQQRQAAQRKAQQQAAQQQAAAQQTAARAQAAQQPTQQQVAQQQEQLMAQRRAQQQARAHQQHAQAQQPTTEEELARKEREAREQAFLEKMARKNAESATAGAAALGAEAAQSAHEPHATGMQPALNPEDFYQPTPAANFSREAYTSGERKVDRESIVKRLSNLRGGEDGGEFPFSKKLIAIIAAIFIVVVILFVVNPLGCGNSSTNTPASTSSSTAATTAVTPTLPTPIMSESSGVLMHSAVPMEYLTEILIHNASFGYANEITTRLTEATNTDIIAAHGTGRVASEQPSGDEWMTGEFIRCFRSGNAGPTMSAIDCGGPVGTKVYAPVTGKVMLVKEYKLYNEIDDYRVHIQPEGRPDLDVVLIHLTDVTVKAGDHVIGGETPIGSIRDVYQYLGESLQLGQYTALDDNGNHTHIQVNNVNNPEYHGLDDLKENGSAGAAAGDAQIDS